MATSRSSLHRCSLGSWRVWRGGAAALIPVFLFLFAWAAARAEPTGDPPSPYHCWLEKELAHLYEEVSPAIVSVVSYRARATSVSGGQPQGGPSYTLRRLVASGIVVGSHGCVVTPARVALPGDSIVVHFPGGQRVAARYKGMDPATNIAVLNLVSTGPFPYLEPPGESDPAMPEWVAAVAYGPWNGPNPGWPTVSLSQKSSIERWETRYGQSTGEMWQLHAPIMPGNQGGALVSLSGKWVGLITGVVTGDQGPRQPRTSATDVNSRSARDEGVIVPAAIVARAIREIESGQRTVSGFLGVQTEPAGRGAAAGSSSGVVVLDVLPDSPADRYGILPGDFIFAFEGQPVNSVGELTRLVQASKPGAWARLDILRNDQRRQFRVCVGDSDSAELFFLLRRDQIQERQWLQQELRRLRNQQRMIERRLRTTEAPGSRDSS
jgi:S1-C subfamily serine protease